MVASFFLTQLSQEPISTGRKRCTATPDQQRPTDAINNRFSFLLQLIPVSLREDNARFSFFYFALLLSFSFIQNSKQRSTDAINNKFSFFLQLIPVSPGEELHVSLFFLYYRLFFSKTDFSTYVIYLQSKRTEFVP
jgi:hypothetical protein